MPRICTECGSAERYYAKGLCARCYDRRRPKRVKNDPETSWARTTEGLYNVDASMYAEMLRVQDGGCYICGKTPEENGQRLSVDHDHGHCSGKASCGLCVRGLLCQDCNTGLGQFRDNPDLLEAAAFYLRLRAAPDRAYSPVKGDPNYDA